MALPVRISPDRGLPPEIVVFSDPRAERVGQTLERAYAAGKDYFRRELDIIFVVLPEYGECLFAPLLHQKVLALLCASLCPTCPLLSPYWQHWIHG